jgi:BirA family biotin operon repressor/biotin-[acetyl-CoA-carboxylase] ligase
MCAVAVSEAIEDLCSVECGIKWVNDIYIGNKKVCGILTEAAQLTDKLDYAVVGIGVNVTEPKGGFNDEIKDIATSLYEKNAPVNIKNRLIAKILEKFFHYYSNIKDKAFISKYREKSNLIGKSVDIYRGNEIITGICVDIDENANLVIEKNGEYLTFNSGDARVKRQ